MKNILIALMLIPLLVNAQSKETLIKNYKGIEIVGTYDVNKKKEGKTEYKVTVTYTNKSDNNIFFKKNNKAQELGKVFLIDKKSYTFPIVGSNEKRGNLKLGMLRKGQSFDSFVYFIWYKDNEVPKFELSVNENSTLETE